MAELKNASPDDRKRSGGPVSRAPSTSGGVRTGLARTLGGARSASCLGLLTLATIPPFFTGAQSQLAWSVMGIAVLVSAAVFLAATLRRPRRLPAPAVLVTVCLLALLVLVQLVPLPAPVVGALSPRRAELAERAEAALGREPPGVLPLTLSTGTTRDALCLLAVYTFAFLASGLLFRRPSRVKLLFAALAVSGACLALWGVGLVLFGRGLPLTSTYTNRNRLAALLVMDFFAGVGWVMLTLPRSGVAGLNGARPADFSRLAQVGSAQGRRAEPLTSRWERVAAAACAGATALGIVMTLSRLGLASVAVSLVLLAFVAFKVGMPGQAAGGKGPRQLPARGPVRSADQAGTRGDRRVLLAGASVTVSAILGSLLTSVDPVLARYSLLFEHGVGRLTCWRTSLGVVRDFPLTGSGAGSFRHVFSLYQRAGELTGFWKYAHSDLLNTLTDLGPVGLVLLLAAVFFWYRAVRRGFAGSSVFRKTVAWVGVGAVSAVLVHSLADFVLKQPANALVFSVLAGAVAGTCGRRRCPNRAGTCGCRRCPDRTGTVGARPARALPRPFSGALAVVPVAFAVLLFPVAKAGYWKARAEEAQQPDQRAEALMNALRHDPRDGEARLAAAQALADAIPKGEPGAETGTAEEVLALLHGAPPGETIDARAVYLAGGMLWQIGEAARADVAMRAAAELASAYDDVTFQVGVYFLRRWMETRGGDVRALDLSVEYLRRACLASPRRLGQAFDLLSLTPASASRMGQIVPPDAASRLRAARYLERAGRAPEAREVLEPAAKEAPEADRARVFELLAVLRDETGDPEGALEARLLHVTATPVESRPRAASRHVEKLLRQRRPADARLFVGALRRRFPTEPAGLYAEAAYATASGEHVLAYRALLQYTERSVDAEGYHRLAEAARRLGRLAEAEKYAGHAIELEPRKVRYLLARAALRRAAGDADGAALDLRSAVEVDPDDARARRRLASVYLEAGRPLHAVAVWKEAVVRNPRDMSAHVALARAYDAAGLHNEALRHARRAAQLEAEIDPKGTRARDLLKSMGVGDAPAARPRGVPPGRTR